MFIPFWFGQTKHMILISREFAKARPEALSHLRQVELVKRGTATDIVDVGHRLDLNWHLTRTLAVFTLAQRSWPALEWAVYCAGDAQCTSTIVCGSVPLVAL